MGTMLARVREFQKELRGPGLHDHREARGHGKQALKDKDTDVKSKESAHWNLERHVNRSIILKLEQAEANWVSNHLGPSTGSEVITG
jgi:hypothetical protein